MKNAERKKTGVIATQLAEDEETLSWKVAAENKIKRNLERTHEERFLVMMRLMRIGKMLSGAKVTHKNYQP